ncbi:MAG TPA: DUF885 domain-containing protein [Candidatus Brevibacterium intestinigallinarum]|nr:DUF885 domain-containing protein [Candidatus Brevibacterium intestinigallinarum]
MSASTPQTPARTPSPVDAVAEDHFAGMLALSPSLRIEVGADGPAELDDVSPGGLAAWEELRTRTLAALPEAEAAARAQGTFDETDAVTADALRERLGLERELHALGADLSELNVIASPLQSVREFFDLVPTASAEDWEANAIRLRAVGQTLAGHRESLLEARASGRVAARTQVEAVAAQAGDLARAGGHFDAFVATAGPEVSDGLRRELEDAASHARTACDRFGSFLTDQLLSDAPEDDAVGREEYALHSRMFLGAEVDLDETYEWGLEQLAAIDAEQREIAESLYPGATVRETMQRLDEDPARKLHGLDALRTWMQSTADAATEAMAGTHFDISDPVRTIECMVLEDGTGGIYYTPPTADFSRPGRMWWSVPAGVETFSTWQETTTVYHEGVPGHHLQFGAAVMQDDVLNSWRKQGVWVSGHGEGWALYAERLMDELGFLADPGDRFGMLDSQRLRAARVCVDIGVHCRKRAPESLGGGVWDREKAWQFLTENVAMERSFLDFELKRYLGWPGQAPSYSVGQRIWQDLRLAVQAQEEAAGREFSLRDFHSRALALGSVGLSTLQKALLGGF